MAMRRGSRWGPPRQKHKTQGADASSKTQKHKTQSTSKTQKHVHVCFRCVLTKCNVTVNSDSDGNEVERQLQLLIHMRDPSEPRKKILLQKFATPQDQNMLSPYFPPKKRRAFKANTQWARCGARLGRADPRLAAPRAESNLHPRVPTGPASPCSPPLVTALWLVRGSIRAIVSSAGGEAGGDGRLRGAPPWAFESRGPAAALSVARRALGCCLRPARSLYNAVGCREVVPGTSPRLLRSLARKSLQNYLGMTYE